jgi:MATE family multidrug resistance protein
MFQEIVNLIFVGHLNDAQVIAGVGLGNAFISMVAISTIVGMNGALNTLCNQSEGAKRTDLSLLYLKRSRVVISIMFIPIYFILSQTSTILIYTG